MCIRDRAHTASEKLPVAVWIHGGGFEHGFSTELEFDGEAYAKKGVILATISYRVNVFGFLYDQKQEEELGFSGNQGLLDQVAALEWISENIAAFGGNPDNITIMGQSAGAMSSHVLTFSPLATPMIHQAKMCIRDRCIVMHSIFYDTRIVRVRSTDQSGIKGGGKIPFDPNVFPFI